MKKKKTFSLHQGKTENTAKTILEFLYKNPNKQFNYKQISAALKMENRGDKELVLKSLQKLVSKNEIEQMSAGKYRYTNTNLENYIGKIDFTQSSSAYVIVEGQEQDIFIQKSGLGKALDGDIVRVEIINNNKIKPEGKIIEVIERFKTEFVGILDVAKNDKFGFVIVAKNKIHIDIFIPKSKFKDAKHGQKVICRINDWPDENDSPIGEIIEVLGDPGEHNVEIHSILAEYGLPFQFPEEVEKEANSIDTKITEEEIAKRRDMRGICTFTIDPKDAKDFDDALSIQKLENGNWEIGVHIADVSHYVKEGSLLDEEAYKRATSVYLVDRVVPMLPEILSNNVCSLRPNEEKLTFSAIFEMDDNAEIKKSWYGRTVILSDKRFTYEEAQEIIEGKEAELKNEVLTLDRLAKILRNERLKEGAIAFDRLEIKFNLDENNEPLGVFFKESKDSNHLIEEFMLLANKKVSEFVSLNKDNSPNNKTFVYRIHDDPDPTKLQTLKNFVKTFGYDLRINSPREISSSLNTMLKDVKGKGEENMIETLAMRSMSKAIYSTQNIGHYGLAFDNYSHFTSPIRRYPDVIAHRLLQHYLENKQSPDIKKYEEDCKHCSARERLAADAERDSTKYMQVKFMEKHIGEVFDGVISGVTEFGIYVETKMTKAEGLIRLRNIHDDHYKFDEKTYSIVGQKTGIRYQLGDEVQIKMLKADLERKQIDFELV